MARFAERVFARRLHRYYVNWRGCAGPRRVFSKEAGQVVAEFPEGYRITPDEDRAKAQRFFEPAATRAAAGQYDYAIELYLQGLNLDPDAVEAHKALRDMSLRRKASGGKALGMLDKMKIKSSKEDKQNMLNAEKLLAYDPGERSYMADVFQNSIKAGCFETALLMSPTLLQANVSHPKADIKYFFVLRDGYKQLNRWKLASEALAYAVQMRPEDMDLNREQRDLATLNAMQEGNYEQGDFRQSMRDVDRQQSLMEQDREIHTVDAMTRQINEAEQEYRADPLETGKLMRYVEVLSKTDDSEYENKAIEVLEEAHKRTKQYRFRLAIHRIQMKQMDRMERAMRAEVAANKADESLLKDYKAYLKEKYERELAIFTEASEEYPTDMTLKYEASLRLIRLNRHDEGIPALQLVRGDPKYRTDGSILLGQAFLNAGFPDEAADTFAHASEEYQVRNDPKSLQIYYWWGRSLEAKTPPDTPAALKCYSQVFQWNAAYLAVCDTMKCLRAGPTQTPPAVQ